MFSTLILYQCRRGLKTSTNMLGNSLLAFRRLTRTTIQSNGFDHIVLPNKVSS
ncbi:hypothetical protein AAZX31_04G124500 [Glycine max]